MDCNHKFIHLETEAFSESTGRYMITWKRIDRFYCEKCLEEKEIIKRHESVDSHNLPDWAKTITNHRS